MSEWMCKRVYTTSDIRMKKTCWNWLHGGCVSEIFSTVLPRPVVVGWCHLELLICSKFCSYGCHLWMHVNELRRCVRLTTAALRRKTNCWLTTKWLCKIMVSFLMQLLTTFRSGAWPFLCWALRMFWDNSFSVLASWHDSIPDTSRLLQTKYGSTSKASIQFLGSEGVSTQNDNEKKFQFLCRCERRNCIIGTKHDTHKSRSELQLTCAAVWSGPLCWCVSLLHVMLPRVAFYIRDVWLGSKRSRAVQSHGGHACNFLLLRLLLQCCCFARGRLPIALPFIVKGHSRPFSFSLTLDCAPPSPSTNFKLDLLSVSQIGFLCFSFFW